MTPVPDYVAWGTTSQGGFATLLPIENVEDSYELSEGLSRAEGFPPTAAFRMNPSYPRDVKLADAIHSRGGDGIPILSPALREAFEAAEPPDMEYLPVTIYDHKDRVASDVYVIANSYHVIDCLDHDAMDIEWNPLDPMSIMSCEQVVLDTERLPGAPAVFRAKNMEKRVLVRRDVAEALQASQFTGLWFDELEDVST